MNTLSYKLDRRSRVSLETQLYNIIIQHMMYSRPSRSKQATIDPVIVSKSSGLSLSSVIQVLETLVANNWLKNIKKEYVVNEIKFYSDYFTSLKSISEAIIDIGHQPTIQEVFIKKQNMSVPSFKSEIDIDQDAMHIRRIIYADAFPLVVYDSYTRQEYVYDAWDVKTPLFLFLKEKGISMHLKKRFIELERADDAVAGLLNLPVGTPIFKMYGSAYDQQGKPIQTSVGYVHPNFVVNYHLDQ